MMKNSTLKKIVCLAVCVLLVLSLPLMAFAEESAMPEDVTTYDASPSQDADETENTASAFADLKEAADTASVPEEPAEGAAYETEPAAPVTFVAPAEPGVAGAETVQGASGTDVVQGASGAETVQGASGAETVQGAAGGKDAGGDITNAKPAVLKAAPVLRASSAPDSIDYSGDQVGFYKKDGVSSFGMLSLQEGSKYVLDGNNVRIYDVPSNKTVYKWIHWGLTDDEDLTHDVAAMSDGCWEFELSADKCGKGVAVAPVKENGGTTSSQYYLCIPAKSKMPLAADFSAVDRAIASVPADLSIYTVGSTKAVTDAVDATKDFLFKYKTEDEQSDVDAAAKAISDAVAALVRTDEGEDTTYTVTFKAADQDSGKAIAGAAFTVKDSKGNTVKADKAGVYTLADGTYTVTATAADYEDSVLSGYAPVKDETVTLKLKHKEVIPPGTTVFREDASDPSKTNLFNTTGMFKVVKGTLVSNGDKSTLTVSLSGSGYHYLYKGTYEECLANGLDKSKWIAGKVNSDGKWEFVIPVGQTETFIPIVAISNTHLEKVEKGEEELGDAIFARQLVIDPKAKTLTTGDYDAVIDIRVISKSDVFKADSKGTMEVIGGPNSNNYACKPVITMLDERFSKAFTGTAADAAKDGAAVIKKSSGAFAFSFVNTFGSDGKVMMFEDKKPIAVAFYDTKDSKWVDYKLTIDKSASTVTIEALGEDEAPPEKPSQPDKKDKDSSSSTTKKVDNSTGLADGTYKPDSFSFSGGTGKVRIVCDSIEIKDGKAYATIRFTKRDGSPASVDMLRASGKTYSGSNKFTVPVQLNKNNKIVARTTAMSQPHWVEYTIYIGLDAAGGASGGGLSNTTDLDEEAPAILGLTATGEVETPFSDLVKIFSYEGGYYLIELDVVRDTARDTVEERTVIEAEMLKESAPDAAGTESTGEQAEDVSEAAEEEVSESDSISAKIAGLYKNEVLKYLVVPNDKEVPAGMDKEILIIKQPVERAYVSSADAYSILEDINHDGNVTMIGFEDARNEKTFAGPCDDWDIKAMLLEKTDLAVQSSEILPSDKKPVDESMDNLVRLGERAAQLGFAMFIDRSRDEASSLGTAEWLKVYGVIFNDIDTASALYEEATDSAADSEKETALGILKTRAEEKAEMKAQAKEAASKA